MRTVKVLARLLRCGLEMKSRPAPGKHFATGHSYITGTLAAAFQSFIYGGFTPTRGIFATLTSMGILRYLMPLKVGLAAVITTVTTLIV